MYMFIDPGVNTGWALFEDNGNEIDVFTTRSFEKTCKQLRDLITINTKLNYKRIFIEDFRLYPSKAQAQLWSQFETVQVIGAVRARCLEFNIPYEVVPARNKDIGFMYLGIKEPSHSDPSNHQMVAFAHGVFWLQNQGIRPPTKR